MPSPRTMLSNGLATGVETVRGALTIILVTALITGGGSYIAFASTTPSRQDVRTMIAEEESPINKRLDIQLDLLKLIEQRGHEQESSIAAIDKRLAVIEAELTVLNGPLAEGPH